MDMDMVLGLLTWLDSLRRTLRRATLPRLAAWIAAAAACAGGGGGGRPAGAKLTFLCAAAAGTWGGVGSWAAAAGTWGGVGSLNCGAASLLASASPLASAAAVGRCGGGGGCALWVAAAGTWGGVGSTGFVAASLSEWAEAGGAYGGGGGFGFATASPPAGGELPEALATGRCGGGGGFGLVAAAGVTCGACDGGACDGGGGLGFGLGVGAGLGLGLVFIAIRSVSSFLSSFLSPGVPRCAVRTQRPRLVRVPSTYSTWGPGGKPPCASGRYVPNAGGWYA